ncbi:MAG: NAD(P)H-dependent glycerol-3-phosphate dehydrogenase [Chlamydiota bacterium]|nr:NAD(P)H-dependent glycerol-3-phosphate dehydrogenase [Chlamydiota bacterium]
MQRIAVLGVGDWGRSLASLLARLGHQVTLWGRQATVERISENLQVTNELAQALEGADLVVESVTSQGLRPVLKKMMEILTKPLPLVITSKGIEQGTGWLLPEVALEVMGSQSRKSIGILSGPSLAKEVNAHLPTSVVAAAYTPPFTLKIQQTFNAPLFRVYPNHDIQGVAFGGAMKNIIAIACALSDGLGFGENARAALITRGLHEIRKLSTLKSCQEHSLNGLAGVGDLIATCLSLSSRNYQFGTYLAQGLSPQEAKEKVGKVVEGAYTCRSVKEMSEESGIPVPITEAIYAILYEGKSPGEAVDHLLSRLVKLEHL